MHWRFSSKLFSSLRSHFFDFKLKTQNPRFSAAINKSTSRKPPWAANLPKVITVAVIKPASLSWLVPIGGYPLSLSWLSEHSFSDLSHHQHRRRRRPPPMMQDWWWQQSPLRSEVAAAAVAVAIFWMQFHLHCSLVRSLRTVCDWFWGRRIPCLLICVLQSQFFLQRKNNPCTKNHRQEIKYTAGWCNDDESERVQDWLHFAGYSEYVQLTKKNSSNQTQLNTAAVIWHTKKINTSKTFWKKSSMTTALAVRTLVSSLICSSRSLHSCNDGESDYT